MDKLIGLLGHHITDEDAPKFFDQCKMIAYIVNNWENETLVHKDYVRMGHRLNVPVILSEKYFPTKEEQDQKEQPILLPTREVE